MNKLAAKTMNLPLIHLLYYDANWMKNYNSEIDL